MDAYACTRRIFSTIYTHGDQCVHRIKEVNSDPLIPSRNDGACILSLMGPANGVFCIRFDMGDLALWNPAMRELRRLSPIPFHQSEYVFGFGYDPSTGDLKVVGFSEVDWVDMSDEDNRIPNSAYVYNSITDSWKKIHIKNYEFLLLMDRKCQTLLNGVYYWCVCYNDNGGILAFDMRSESFRMIDFPDCINRNEYLRVVGHGDSVALHLIKSDLLESHLRCKCVGEMHGNSVSLRVCEYCKCERFGCKCERVGELWVLGKEGFWSKISTVSEKQVCCKLWRVPAET